MKALTKAITVVLALAQPALSESVEKIAVAGGEVTEIIFELGVGDKVVAVDSTSVYPAAVQDLPSVGYVRELSAEGVLATGADMLIGSEDMGPPAVMDNLAAAGMRVEFAPTGKGVGRFVDKVNFVAGALGLEQRGAEMIADFESKVAEVSARRDALPRSPRVLVILAVREGAPIAAGDNTSGNDIVTLSGGQNVATFEGWKPMTSEAVIGAAPEIIVLSTVHVKRMGGIEAVMELPSVRATPAGVNQSFVVVDSQMMLQFGPRAPLAMEALVTAFEKAVAE